MAQAKKITEPKNFADRLRSAIFYSTSNKSDVARDVGVHPVTMSRWLKDRVPDAVTAMRLATRLGVRLNWLLTGDGPMTDNGHPIVRDATKAQGQEDEEEVETLPSFEGLTPHEATQCHELLKLRDEIEWRLDALVTNSGEQSRDRLHRRLDEYSETCSSLSPKTSKALLDEMKRRKRKQ